jgi:hypothetical protein
VAELHRAVAALRIVGDELLPEDVTAALGCEPSKKFARGEVLEHPMRPSRTARFGLWSLEAVETEPADLDAQIIEVLGRVTADPGVWADLGRAFAVSLFCGWFMESWNEGVFVSPVTLAALGARGIALDIDLYGPSDADDDE